MSTKAKCSSSSDEAALFDDALLRQIKGQHSHFLITLAKTFNRSGNVGWSQKNSIQLANIILPSVDDYRILH